RRSDDWRPMMDLAATLRRIRRQWLATAALEAGARAAAAIAVLVAAAALAERWLHPSDGMLLAITAVTALLAICIAIVLVRPLRRQPDDRQIARFIEERFPELEDTLVTAVYIGARTADDNGFAPLVI